jgi:HrpA-like RNA helicase
LKKESLTGAFNLKTYLSESLKNYQILKKDTQEVKAEFNKIVNQDRSPLIKDKLSKSLIQNDLLKKTSVFDRNISNLRKKFLKAADLVKSIEKQISEK